MASKLFQEALAQATPETTERVKSYLDRLDESKTFEEIEIGQRFSPIYKDPTAKLTFQKIDSNRAQVVERIDGGTLKLSIHYIVGDKIWIEIDDAANNRFLIVETAK